jgi:hypothetical protein
MNLSPLPIQKFFDSNGNPLVGGKLFTYVAGTSTKIATYTDSTGGTSNTNPIVLNFRGECAVWMDPTKVYKLALAPSTDTDPPSNAIWTADNIRPAVDYSTLTATFIGQIIWPRTAAEISALVTPSDYSYPPYDVRRYGAAVDGITDSSAAFNQASLIGVTAFVPELAGVPFVLNSDVSGTFYSTGQPRFAGAGKVALTPSLGTPKSENNYGLVGAFPRTCSVMVVGDSITAGTGVSSYPNSVGWLVGRSLMNSSDRGVFNDWGIGYHRILNANSFLQSTGVTTTGISLAAGVFGSRIQITPGQSLTLTLREVKSFDVIYDASTSSGSFDIKLNGTTIRTVAVVGTGLKTTFPTSAKTGSFMTRLGDTLSVQCTAGSLQICGIMDLKNSTVNDMLAYVGAQAGYAYQDYNTAAAMDELAFYLNNLRTANDKALVMAIGTNNLYNATKALSPTAMIAAITTFVTGMQSRCTNLQIAISVPPKSNESLFPMILAFKYEDYVRAIVSYALRNNLVLIRHDLGGLNDGTYYSDGLHPNDVGAKIFAQTICQAMRIKYDVYFKNTDFALSDYLTELRTDIAITPVSTWAAFGGLTSFQPRAHAVAGVCYLSGNFQRNGSVSLTIGNLPAAFRPDTQDRYFSIAKDVAGAGGQANLKIAATGDLALLALPVDNVSLDGISFPLQKFIET